MHLKIILIIEENIIEKCEEKILELMRSSQEKLVQSVGKSNEEFLETHLGIIEYLTRRSFYK